MHVLVELLLEEVDDLPGIEPQVASIRGEHALSIATLGDVLEVSLLEGDEDLLLELEDLRGLAHGEAKLSTTVKEHLAKARARRHCRLHLLEIVLSGLEVLETLLVEKHVARLRAVGGTHDALVLEHVHDSSCSSVPHGKRPLEAGGGTKLRVHNDVRGLPEERVVRGGGGLA